MTFGVALPLADLAGGPLRAGSVARNAEAVELAGFSSLWTFDALGRGFLLPDPLTSLAIASGVTERITLGTGILQLPHRPMVDVASRALTLAAAVGDRLVLGVGPGSTQDDFVLTGASYRDRFDDFEVKLAELRSYLDTGAFDGRHLAPAKPSVDVTVALAGWRGAMVERAARDGCPWIASGYHASDAELVDGIERYRGAGGTRAVVTNVRVDDVDAAVVRARALAVLGFDDVVLMDATPSAERLAALAAGLGPNEPRNEP